ncbi:hypothetical protein Tco_0906228 [Tanacetum coccineum]
MNTTQAQQKALDDALVASANRTNKPAMLESNAYKTYYAFASGEKTPNQSGINLDKKIAHAKKPKAKGLAVLSESKVPNEQQQKTSGTDEGAGTLLGVPDVPTYESESEKESWGDSDEEDDDEDDFDNDSDDNDESDNERTESDRDEIPDPNKTNKEHNEEEEECDDEFNIEKEEKINDEESMDEEEDNEATKELYNDVNVNLGNEDTDMTNADQEATSKFLKITSSFTITVPPLPPFFNPLSQQATPTPTPTASDTTTSLHALLDFAFVFKFNERVFNLEKDVSEIKQVDQYAQALSSIPAIVDRYMDKKLGEAINKTIQAHNFDCREEAQADKKECIELVDSTIRSIIKEEVNTQLPQILSQAISDVATHVIEKNVTESLEVAVLTRSRPSAGSDQGKKRRKSSKDAESSRDSQSKEKKSSKEPSHTVKDSDMQPDQELVTGDNDEQPADKEVTKADWFKKPERPPTPDPDWSKRQHVDFRPPQT